MRKPPRVQYDEKRENGALLELELFLDRFDEKTRNLVGRARRLVFEVERNEAVEHPFAEDGRADSLGTREDDEFFFRNMVRIVVAVRR